MWSKGIERGTSAESMTKESKDSEKKVKIIAHEKAGETLKFEALVTGTGSITSPTSMAWMQKGGADIHKEGGH